jgi:2,3-bisphosphoglycerate-dependent phosphoglycerate mutase
MGGGGCCHDGQLQRGAVVSRRPWLSWGKGVAVLLFGYCLSVVVALSSSSPCSSTQGDSVHTLILCRHGDSVWNGGEPGTRETFTGWTNVPLSRKGIQEAKATGQQVTKFCESSTLDACFTSVLQRAQLTAHYCLWGASENHQDRPFIMFPPKYFQDYRLNERHYGALQGFVKEDVEQGLYGHDPQLVQQWRRSWSTVPPLLDDDLDPRRIQEIKHFAAHCGGPEHVPRGESIEQVANQRIRPFLKERLCPVLQRAAKQRQQHNAPSTLGGTGLVVAHANSLRALIGVICNVQDDVKALRKLESLRLQTAVPLVLRFRVLSSRAGSIEIDSNQHEDYDQYQPCDLDGIPFGNKHDESSTKRQPLVPELPLYPLNGKPIPKKSITPHNQSRHDHQHGTWCP